MSLWELRSVYMNKTLRWLKGEIWDPTTWVGEYSKGRGRESTRWVKDSWCFTIFFMSTWWKSARLLLLEDQSCASSSLCFHCPKEGLGHNGHSMTICWTGRNFGGRGKQAHTYLPLSCFRKPLCCLNLLLTLQAAFSPSSQQPLSKIQWKGRINPVLLFTSRSFFFYFLFHKESLRNRICLKCRRNPVLNRLPPR